MTRTRRGPRTMPRRIACLATVALLAACTSSTDGHGQDVLSPGPSDTTAAPPPSAPTSAPPTSEPATPSSPIPSATPVSSSAAASSVPPAGPRTTCTSVSVRVIRGSAAPGQEIAALQFVNTGATGCRLAGYPSAVLLRNGRVLGQPSEPSSHGASVMQLAPGDVAESLLHDYTQTCSTPLSDSLRVTVPGTAKAFVRPQLQMRACILRVDPLGPPA